MVFIISRKLYGIKMSGHVWKETLVYTLTSLGYRSSEADANVCMGRYLNPNSDPYHKYMLCYVGNLIHIGFQPKEDMDVLNFIYPLKEGFSRPDRCLCDNVEKVKLEN